MSRCAFFQGEVYSFLQILEKICEQQLRISALDTTVFAQGPTNPTVFSYSSTFLFFFTLVSPVAFIVFIFFLELQSFSSSSSFFLCYTFLVESLFVRGVTWTENLNRQAVLTSVRAGLWGWSHILMDLRIRPCTLKHLPLVMKL